MLNSALGGLPVGDNVAQRGSNVALANLACCLVDYREEGCVEPTGWYELLIVLRENSSSGTSPCEILDHLSGVRARIGCNDVPGR